NDSVTDYGSRDRNGWPLFESEGSSTVRRDNCKARRDCRRRPQSTNCLERSDCARRNPCNTRCMQTPRNNRSDRMRDLYNLRTVSAVRFRYLLVENQPYVLRSYPRGRGADWCFDERTCRRSNAAASSQKVACKTYSCRRSKHTFRGMGFFIAFSAVIKLAKHLVLQFWGRTSCR